MGSWGYQPRDGDGPWDGVSLVTHKAIAPYLIAMFKQPMRKGSRKIVADAAAKAAEKEAGVTRESDMKPRKKRKRRKKAKAK